ncbi:MAG: hypothetical protein H0T57_01785 [Rubrobacter sp.]|nr:hypothetical protein [Rubrobacter sp.]
MLAAVGTALPETMIPVVAILGAVYARQDPGLAGEIGIGAILGAPFTLATLAMFVVGASALVYRKRREQGAEIRCREANAGPDFPWCKAVGRDVMINEETIARDVLFFLVFFALAAAVGILGLPFILKVGVAILLTVAYADYIRRTLHSGEAMEEVPERLTLWRFRSRPPLFAVVAQGGPQRIEVPTLCLGCGLHGLDHRPAQRPPHEPVSRGALGKAVHRHPCELQLRPQHRLGIVPSAPTRRLHIAAPPSITGVSLAQDRRARGRRSPEDLRPTRRVCAGCPVLPRADHQAPRATPR